jgi:hypothetical protein
MCINKIQANSTPQGPSFDSRLKLQKRYEPRIMTRSIITPVLSEYLQILIFHLQIVLVLKLSVGGDGSGDGGINLVDEALSGSADESGNLGDESGAKSGDGGALGNEGSPSGGLEAEGIDDGDLGNGCAVGVLNGDLKGLDGGAELNGLDETDGSGTLDDGDAGLGGGEELVARGGDVGAAASSEGVAVDLDVGLDVGENTTEDCELANHGGGEEGEGKDGGSEAHFGGLVLGSRFL